MAVLNSIHDDDSRWPEVDDSSSYAMFIGCLQMAVRALGYLVVTWATAVLLGGFVSDLNKRDFVVLTVITVLQATGVFNFFLKERTNDLVNFVRGLRAAVDATLSSKKRKLIILLTFVGLVAGLISAFVLYLAVLLLYNVPGLWINAVLWLCILAVLGLWILAVLRVLISEVLRAWNSTGLGLLLLISAVLSIWCLIKVHDYGGSAKDEKKEEKEKRERLMLALKIVYCLGVAQFTISFLLSLGDWVARPRLAKKMAATYRLPDVGLVSEYLDKMVTGCMKHHSFARGRNLVTYAVDLLMESTTPTISSSSSSRACSKYVSGLTILGSILQRDGRSHPQKLSRLEDCCLIVGWWRDPAESLHGVQSAMLKQLLTASASFDQVIHRLLETLGPGSPYSGEVREHAARILAEVAGSVRLEEFPGATRCISSSLLGTLEEHCWRPEGYERDSDLPEEYERDWLLKDQERSYLLVAEHWRRTLRSRRLDLKNRRRRRCCCCCCCCARSPPPQVPLPPKSDDDGEKSRRSLLRGYVGLVVSGLRVFQELAASEDNCRFISSTRGGGEVSRIVRPLASDGLHRDHHDEWCMVAQESLKLLSLLTAAPGETGTALRALIAGDTAGAVAALDTVLGCPRCPVALKRQAAEVLLGLPPPVDTFSVFMGVLLHIFLLPDKYFGGMSGPTHVLKKRSCTRRLAGEKLLAMVSALQQPSEDHGGGASATATSMLQAAGAALSNLTSTVVGAGNDAQWRIHAARILQDLCQDYTKDDEYLKEIKKAMCLAMQEVIKQLLDGRASTTQAETVTEAKTIEHCQAPAAGIDDLEQGVVSDDTIGEETGASPHQQQPEDDEQPEGIIMELYQALVCHGIPNSWIEADKDLASELNGIAAEMCAKEGMPFISTFTALQAELRRRYCWEEKNDRIRTN